MRRRNSAGQVLLTANGGCQRKPGHYIKTGGKDVITGTVEVIRDLPHNLGVATFFDYGNAFNSFRRPDCAARSDAGERTICPPFIQYSVGVGLRVRLPVMTSASTLRSRSRPNAGPRLHINFSPKL